MSQKVLEQIKKLSNLEYTLDNGSTNLDQYFSEITFKKRNADEQAVDSIRVVFEDYIIKKGMRNREWGMAPRAVGAA